MERLTSPSITKKIVNKTIVVLGDSKVGKTSFIKRYVENKFKDTYNETIGVDFFNKKIKNKEEIYSYQLWDTNGYENEFKYLSPQIYKLTSMFIILCSFDNFQSFENIELWLNHINNISKSLNKSLIHFIPIVLIINKNDLKNAEKKFKFSDVNQKIKNLNYSISAYTFSAKDLNCKDVFEKIEYLLSENFEKNNSTNKDTFSHTPNGTSLHVEGKSFLGEKENKRNTFKITRNSTGSKDLRKKSGSCC